MVQHFRPGRDEGRRGPDRGAATEQERRPDRSGLRRRRTRGPTNAGLFPLGPRPAGCRRSRPWAPAHQRPRRNPGRPSFAETPLPAAAACSPPTASTNGNRGTDGSSPGSSHPPTAASWPWPACGRPGATKRRSCVPAPSSPPPPTELWALCTTGCRSSCRLSTGTCGSTGPRTRLS